MARLPTLILPVVVRPTTKRIEIVCQLRSGAHGTSGRAAFIYPSRNAGTKGDSLPHSPGYARMRKSRLLLALAQKPVTLNLSLDRFFTSMTWKSSDEPGSV